MIQKNPSMANSALSDPRMIEVLGVLMGVDLQASTRPEGSEELPPGAVPTSPSTSSAPPPPKPTPSTSSAPPPPAQEDVVMEDLDDEEAKAKKDAEAAKKAGSEAYKKRDFEVAAENFQKAWDLWPKDITFLTNLGGRRS